MPVPWKLEPKYHKVQVDAVTVFDVPIYPYQLVDEVIFDRELKTQDRIVRARAYVIFCLRHRDVIDSSVDDLEISKKLPIPLVTELHDLFWYGTQDKPEPASASSEEELDAEKKR